jgi:hypothetical protein
MQHTLDVEHGGLTAVELPYVLEPGGANPPGERSERKVVVIDDARLNDSLTDGRSAVFVAASARALR